MRTWGRVRALVIAPVALIALASTGTAVAKAPKPVAGKTVLLERQSGTVTVRAKGARKARPLGALTAVPVGATVDATKGRVGLLAAGGAKAKVSGGAFTVTQQPAGLVLLTLVGGGVRCARGGKPGPAKRRLRFEGSGRFRLVGCYASAATKGAKAARAAALHVTVGADGTVIVMEDGPGGTRVELVRGTAVQVIDWLGKHPQTLAQGGEITFLASGSIVPIPTDVPTPPAPTPAPNPGPAPAPGTGSCAGGITDSATDAVQDPTGPINPLPDLLCASVVRDGANLVVTVQASNPIPDANRPEAFFYTSASPGTTPAGYTLFPCNAWLDLRQVTSGFHGLGVYDCTNPNTVIAPASFSAQPSNTYVATFAAAAAGLSGPFTWRVAMEGTCNYIDMVPDQATPPASAAC